MLVLLQLGHLLFQHELEAERLESNTLSNKMLAHRFDPVETQGVQHGTRALHDAEYGHRKHEPGIENHHHHYRTSNTLGPKGIFHRHVPEHNGQTLMRKRKSPETEVRCRVRHAVEAEFCHLISTCNTAPHMDLNLPIV